MVHVPVLLKEVADNLVHNQTGTYIDGTFGRGGYSRYWLEQNPQINVIGIDRDPSAQAAATDMAQTHPTRFAFKAGEFGNMAALCANTPNLAGIALDIGISSPQVDEAARGFSFRQDGPLDMRMSQQGQSAADIVNGASEKTLADIFWRYGEESKARQIANAIVKDRAITPFTRTQQLADMISRVAPKKGHTHAATKAFQALRIAVNDELGELQRGLEAAQELLPEGGRLAVVTFHSLEDRVVKHFFSATARAHVSHSRHMPENAQAQSPWRLINKQPITPNDAELAANPRARSAKLRVAERINVLPQREA